MAGLVKIEETVELSQPRAAVWPVLAKTDWINRAVKLPAIRYEVEPLPEGGSKVTAHARMMGLSLVWREFPFEWIEPQFYQVRRLFQGGPFAEALVGIRLRETLAGCAVEIFAHFQPRNAFGAFFARHVIGPKVMRDMRKVVHHISEYLAGQQKVAMPDLPRATANLAAIDTGLEKMRAEKVPGILLEYFRTFLIESPDVELSHIRPFTIAKRWRADRWDVLRTFLQATRAGLMNFRWEVLCPNCRSTRLPRTNSLADIRETAHCDVCNIRFDAEFDRSVELKFSIHPSVRPCDEQTFCLIGPGARPHIAAQIHLEPDERREWRVPAAAHEMRVRSVQIRDIAPLPLHSVEIVCDPAKFKLKNSDTTIFVRNPNPFPVQVALESGNGDDEILTAAQVTNWQEFRDLFATEVISPTERVLIGSQIILFTDLRGSTALYSRIGDAPAYALVRDHFKILHDVISAHHGGVVKTIGDSVMATFSDLSEALNAANVMHTKLISLEAEHNIRLQLKCALHVGPCLAVNANDKLDYFGSVVNLAARMLEKCEGDDLVVADDVFRRPETQEFLREIKQNAVADREQFTGFREPIRVWRIPLIVPHANG